MLGNFLKSVGQSLGLASDKPPAFAIPAVFPQIQGKSAGDLAQAAGIKLPNPGAPITLAELLNHCLHTEQDMVGATKVLANGLPQKKAVAWAADSARAVEAKLPPVQKEALAKADAFTANPNAENRAEAAEAAKKAGDQGPGGMAARAASFADVPDGPPVPGGDVLLPTCVTGAVVLAAALSPPATKKMPESPPSPLPQVAPPSVSVAPAGPAVPVPGSKVAIKTAQTFKPFIERGLALAAG